MDEDGVLGVPVFDGKIRNSHFHILIMQKFELA